MLHSWEALIAYTPNRAHYTDDKTVGKVKVGRLLSDGEPDWTLQYSYTVGACFLNVRKMRGAESIMMLFIDFHTMVVRDGIDPKVAHEAFLAIKEYQERIAPDIQGADHA